MKKLLNTVYVTTEGTALKKDGENLVAEVEGVEKARVPMHMLTSVVAFGPILLSPALIGACAGTFIIEWGWNVYLSIILCLLTGPIMRLLNTPEDIFIQARNYIAIILAALPITAMYNMQSAMLRSLGNSRTPLYFLAISSCLNVVLDLLFVLLLDWGVSGIALATVCAQLLSAILCFIHIRKHYPQQKIQVRLPEEFASIPMDAMLIMQVLMNLLENAVIHAQGMQNLWLSVDTVGNKAVFTVADDGCGISLDRLSRLFAGIPDRELSVDATRNNMGIGLSVCNTIIKAHGGEIQAGNRPEGGAFFRFSLELEENAYV